uniref:Uncharacterized protein n=1 Tax=Amphimedon queenslandica TaxID=400682 RepID=A0A1X7V4P2_AMPQE
MHKDELPVMGVARKATIVCEHTAGGVPFGLNTDGTTKNLKKVGEVGINDMVISVDKLQDGTATTAIADVTRELEKLCRIANDLKIPNANASFRQSLQQQAQTQLHHKESFIAS